jgi:PKD repeat protein
MNHYRVAGQKRESMEVGRKQDGKIVKITLPGPVCWLRRSAAFTGLDTHRTMTDKEGAMCTKRLITVLIVAIGLLAVAGGCMFFSRTEAVIEVSSTVGIVPLTITFSGEASTCPEGISTYRWSFGTGEPWYEASGTHTYDHVGQYTLTLTVRGADGETDTKTVDIVVEPAVWICDENLDRVHKLDMNGEALRTFDLPATGPKGVTIAEAGGKTWVFVACYGGGNQRLLRIDQDTGAVTAEYSAPAQFPLYLTYGALEPQRLWHLDGLSRKIYELNPTNGQVLNSFGTNYFHASQQVGSETFLQSPQGLSWVDDGTESGSLWYLEGETKLLYAIDIDPPINIHEGVQLEIEEEPVPVDASVFPVAGMDSYDGYLWVVDRDDHEIVQIDPTTGLRTGVRITGFPGASASGLAIQQ